MEIPYLPQIFLTAQPKSGDSRNFLWTDYDLTVLPLCFWPLKALGSLTVCGTARTFPSAGWRCRRCCEELGWPGLPPGPLAAAGKHWARGSDWVNEEWGWGALPLTPCAVWHTDRLWFSVVPLLPSIARITSHSLCYHAIGCLSFFISFSVWSFLSFLRRHYWTSQGGTFCN